MFGSLFGVQPHARARAYMSGKSRPRYYQSGGPMASSGGHEGGGYPVPMVRMKQGEGGAPGRGYHVVTSKTSRARARRRAKG